jgi:hypothetical protein
MYTWQTLSGETAARTIDWTFAAVSNPTVYLEVEDGYGNDNTYVFKAPAPLNRFSVLDISSSDNSYKEILFWSTYAPVDGAAFGKYEIFRSTDNAFFESLASITGASTDYYIDSTVTGGDTYYYLMYVVDADGDTSANTSVVAIQSGTASDVTPPVISNISTTTTISSAEISWSTDEFSTAQIKYGLTSDYTSASLMNATLATSHTVSLLNLSADIIYHFQVVSQDAAGNVATSSDYTFLTSAVADTEAPTVPGNLTATSTSATEVMLTWVPSNDNVGVAGYAIYRDGGRIATTTLATYADNGLSSATSYTYEILAFDGEGNQSATSSPAIVITRAAADFSTPIISAIASSTSATTATITWTTNEPATAQVAYGLTGSYSAYSILNSDLATSA